MADDGAASNEGATVVVATCEIAKNYDTTDSIVVIDSINFRSLSSPRFSLSSSFDANSFSDSSLTSHSFTCAFSTFFTSEVASLQAAHL